MRLQIEKISGAVLVDSPGLKLTEPSWHTIHSRNIYYITYQYPPIYVTHTYIKLAKHVIRLKQPTRSKIARSCIRAVPEPLSRTASRTAPREKERDRAALKRSRNYRLYSPALSAYIILLFSNFYSFVRLIVSQLDAVLRCNVILIALVLLILSYIAPFRLAFQLM